MKVLLPVDGSNYTNRMLSYISAHSELLDGTHEYTVFTAVAPIPPHAAHLLDPVTLETYYRNEAEAVIAPIRSFLDQQRWSAREVHVPGDAADAIAAFAEAEGQELIVMGTHGRSALGNAILGSVSAGVLARCKVPVLLIR